MNDNTLDAIVVNSTEVLLTDIAGLSEIDQLEIMRAWFYENYEDPVHRSPYETAEGGYQYIWGGPYYAQEELGVFYEHVPEAVIESLAEDLNEECSQWTSAENPDDYEDYYLENILSRSEQLENFRQSLEKISTLLAVDVQGEVMDHHFGLLYVSMVTSIETYLSDIFISQVLGNTENLRRFVEGNPEFEKIKINLSDVFIKHEAISDEVKEYLFSLMWHNLAKMKPMYKATLDVDFPDDISSLFKAVIVRHDLVHRNGKSKNGEIVIISKTQVEQLSKDAVSFVEYIDSQILVDKPAT